MEEDVPEPVRIIGSYLSPYVGKVLVVLHEKGIPYGIDPIVPFFGDDRFAALSPLRRIPVLIDDRVPLSDSSVICQYLEERHPDPPLCSLRTPIAEVRDALAAAGAPILRETYGTAAPRRGVMPI